MHTRNCEARLVKLAQSKCIYHAAASFIVKNLCLISEEGITMYFQQQFNSGGKLFEIMHK